MSIKKLIAILSLLFFSISAFAIPPNIGLESVSKLSNGHTLLRFRYNGEMRKVDDDDGMATLATLYYILTQDLHREIQSPSRGWDSLKTQKVDHWSQFAPVVKDSLKMLAHEVERILESSGIQGNQQYLSMWTNQKSSLSSIVTLLDGISENGAPSYDQLNSLGEFLDVFADNHRYKSLRRSTDSSEYLMSSENFLGSALTSHPFKMGARGGFSRSTAHFKIELATVFANAHQVVMPSLLGGGSQAASSGQSTMSSAPQRERIVMEFTSPSTGESVYVVKNLDRASFFEPEYTYVVKKGESFFEFQPKSVRFDYVQFGYAQADHEANVFSIEAKAGSSLIWKESRNGREAEFTNVDGDIFSLQWQPAAAN